MNQELIAYLDANFEGIAQRFEDMQGQMDRRFDKTDKQIRRTNVVVEGLRSEIQAVAEGHAMLSDKMDQIYGELKVERRQDQDENRSALRRLRRRVERLEATG